MSDKVEITKEMVERVVECVTSEKRPGPTDGYARWILDCALNPPPEPQAVVTEEMAEAGLRKWFNYYDLRPNFQYVAQISEVYRAMGALAPLPEVTDEAVMAFVNEFYIVPTNCDVAAHLKIKTAITKALPILLGRKNGEGVGGAYLNSKDRRTGPKNRRVKEWKLGDPTRRGEQFSQCGRRKGDFA